MGGKALRRQGVVCTIRLSQPTVDTRTAVNSGTNRTMTSFVKRQDDYWCSAYLRSLFKIYSTLDPSARICANRECAVIYDARNSIAVEQYMRNLRAKTHELVGDYDCLFESTLLSTWKKNAIEQAHAVQARWFQMVLILWLTNLADACLCPQCHHEDLAETVAEQWYGRMVPMLRDATSDRVAGSALGSRHGAVRASLVPWRNALRCDALALIKLPQSTTGSETTLRLMRTTKQADRAPSHTAELLKQSEQQTQELTRLIRATRTLHSDVDSTLQLLKSELASAAIARQKEAEAATKRRKLELARERKALGAITGAVRGEMQATVAEVANLVRLVEDMEEARAAQVAAAAAAAKGEEKVREAMAVKVKKGEKEIEVMALKVQREEEKEKAAVKKEEEAEEACRQEHLLHIAASLSPPTLTLFLHTVQSRCSSILDESLPMIEFLFLSSLAIFLGLVGGGACLLVGGLVRAKRTFRRSSSQKVSCDLSWPGSASSTDRRASLLYSAFMLVSFGFAYSIVTRLGRAECAI